MSWKKTCLDEFDSPEAMGFTLVSFAGTKISVWIDLDKLGRDLYPRVVKSKRHRTKLHYGAIAARLVKP